MPAGTRSAIAMLTDFFVADDIEATARRTGFVQRTSKITGKPAIPATDLVTPLSIFKERSLRG